MNKVHIVLWIFAALVVVAVNARITNQRDLVPKHYELLNRADPNQQHEFRIALKQKNIDILEATLLDASNPESENYGKWWSTEKILDLIAPSEREIHSVIEWLKSYGVPSIDASGRDFIKVSAPIRVIERLFKTEIYDFKSKETGKMVARVMGSVHVPDHLDDVIEMVTGLTELMPRSEETSHSSSRIANTKRGAQQGINPLGNIYPGALRYFYDIPSQFPVHPNSSIGFTGFLGDESFAFDDLDNFNIEVDENVTVSMNNVVGTLAGDSLKPTLGVQYGGAIALNTTIWYWAFDYWLYQFTTQMFVAQNYPLVVSIPEGWPEADQCNFAQNCYFNVTHPVHDYVGRINVEFVKLGLKGITLLAASGNQGALGKDNKYCKNNSLSNQFPASSPWVTSVGATMLIQERRPENFTLPQPPICEQVRCARSKLEGVCTPPDGLISSGGGFSNISSMPKWQRQAVSKYLRSGVTLPTGLFDPTKRAYPDVAANGNNFIIVEGNTAIVAGTEASTPVFAGIIALLNSVMLNNNKYPLGFINPLLYKMAADDPTIFTDITHGNNYCTQLCCANFGFVAMKGWDPVTGLGTPVFPKMQAYIQKVLIDRK